MVISLDQIKENSCYLQMNSIITFIDPASSHVLSLLLYFLSNVLDLLCTRCEFQSFERRFWSFLEAREILNLKSQILSNVTNDLSFRDR